MTNHHRLQLHAPAGLWNLSKVIGFLSLQLRNKRLRWFHPTAQLSGASVWGLVASLMAVGTCTNSRALTSQSREHGQPHLGDERVWAMHQLLAFSQHAKVLLCQQLMPCQRAEGKPQAAGKPGSASSCHTAAMPQGPAYASPPACVGVHPNPSPAAITDPSRLTSTLGTDSPGSVAASACGEVLNPILPQAASALAVHHAPGLTSQCWARRGAHPAPLGDELLVVFTALLFPVPLVHTRGENLLSFSLPGIHMKTLSSVSGMLHRQGPRRGWRVGYGSDAAFPFSRQLPGWLLSQLNEKLVPGLLPADESNWIHLGAVHLKKLLSPSTAGSGSSPVGMGCCERAAEVLQLQRPCTACNRDQLLTLDCKSHSIASGVWTDSSSPARVMVTSLGSIAWMTGYDLLMTISSVLNLYQMTARTGDGGKTSLYWVPGLCFENASGVDPYQDGCNVISISPAEKKITS